MSVATIRFHKLCQRLNHGRNGYMEARGIEIWDNPHLDDDREGCVALTPITSRGSSDAARLCITYSALPEVILELVKRAPVTELQQTVAGVVQAWADSFHVATTGETP